MKRWASTIRLRDATLTTVAVANGIVYQSIGETLYAFNADLGKLLWSSATTDESDPLGMLQSDNGIIYAGSLNKLYAFDAKTGRILWINQLLKELMNDPPAYFLSGVRSKSRYGVLYVTAGNPGGSKTVALDAKTGALLWIFRSPPVV